MTPTARPIPLFRTYLRSTEVEDSQEYKWSLLDSLDVIREMKN